MRSRILGKKEFVKRARRKNRPLKRPDEISPPISFGQLLTVGNKILNLVDESRKDHRNALIVQDGYSYWSHGSLTKCIAFWVDA